MTGPPPTPRHHRSARRRRRRARARRGGVLGQRRRPRRRSHKRRRHDRLGMRSRAARRADAAPRARRTGRRDATVQQPSPRSNSTRSASRSTRTAPVPTTPSPPCCRGRTSNSSTTWPRSRCSATCGGPASPLQARSGRGMRVLCGASGPHVRVRCRATPRITALPPAAPGPRHGLLAEQAFGPSRTRTGRGSPQPGARLPSYGHGRPGARGRVAGSPGRRCGSLFFDGLDRVEPGVVPLAQSARRSRPASPPT